MRMSEKQKHKPHELSQLSGKEFDRSCMEYILRDHVNEVYEFKLSTQMVQDPQVKQWAAGTLPVLEGRKAGAVRRIGDRRARQSTSLNTERRVS